MRMNSSPRYPSRRETQRNAHVPKQQQSLRQPCVRMPRWALVRVDVCVARDTECQSRKRKVLDVNFECRRHVYVYLVWKWLDLDETGEHMTPANSGQRTDEQRNANTEVSFDC